MRTSAAVCFLLTSALVWAESKAPTTVQLGDNERVLHLVGKPFTHVYAYLYLETMLRRYYGHRGLVYRRTTGTMADFSRRLDGLLSVHRPTLVILQGSNEDLYNQWRKKVFDFSRYPKVLESVVARLREKEIRVILCSAIPVGQETYDAEPQYHRLQEWVEAARGIAGRHRALFVDLYTKAKGWHMIGGRPRAKHHYDTKHHRKSWDLFLSQVCFQSPASTTRLDAKTGKAVAQGATVPDVKADPQATSLVLQNDAGAGSAMLSVGNLSEGTYAVEVNGKIAATLDADALAAGLDLGKHLRSQAGTRAFRQALEQLHSKIDSLTTIATYRPPNWVKVKNLEEQKQAAIRALLGGDVAKFEAEVRSMVTPEALRIRVLRQAAGD